MRIGQGIIVVVLATEGVVAAARVEVLPAAAVTVALVVVVLCDRLSRHRRRGQLVRYGLLRFLSRFRLLITRII